MDKCHKADHGAIEFNHKVIDELQKQLANSQAENKWLKEEIEKAIKFIDETPRYHDARDTVIDAIKYNLTQALQEKSND